MKAKKILIVLAVCALALVVFATTATAQSDELKFEGTLNGEATFGGWQYPDPPAMPYPTVTISTGVGTIKHLGRVTMYSEHPVPAGDDFAGDMSFTLDAGNGDEIWADYEGFSHFVLADHPLLQRGVGTFDITGGTGQFAGATGAGWMVFELHFPGASNMGPDGPPWKAKWTYEGYIILADD